MAVLLTGCEKPPPEIKLPPTVVVVSQPLERDVVDTVEYPGRTEAIESVEVRCRLTGYLQKIAFEEGKLVKSGDVLFEIDPREFEAELAQANAKIKVAEAKLEFTQTEVRRNETLRRTNAVSQEELERSIAQRDTAAAELASAKADAYRQQLDVEFTKVTAPIAGRVSRANLTVGNLVQANTTVLTTIVRMDKIYIWFDVDERTMLKVQKDIREKRIKSSNEAEFPIQFGLSSETSFDHVARIDFVDNKVNPTTGTLRVRAVIDNTDQIFSPGLFVRVQLPISAKYKALLVTERALGNDQGQKFVYVVNDKKEVEARPVTVGQLKGGLRAITSGIKPTDWVIVNGLQRVRPGAVVEPKQQPMPEGSAGGSLPRGAPPAEAKDEAAKPSESAPTPEKK